MSSHQACCQGILNVFTWPPFIIQTDYQTLQWLSNVKDENSCLVWWSLALQPYQFEIQHRKGRVNANADSLSWILYSRRVLRTGEEGGNVIEADLETEKQPWYML